MHAKTWVITNSGFQFSPSTLTITEGDTVTFTIATMHNAREVSQTTWNASGSTALAGGFQTPAGGGVVLPTQLGVGTHFYVCPPHVGGGMKGSITVTAASTSIIGAQLPLTLSVFPNPTSDKLTIQAGANAIGISYQLLDLTGKHVQTGTLLGETTTLSLDQLPTGVFFLQIGEANKQTFQLLKQ